MGDVLFLIYVTATLFLGTNVKQYLGMEAGEGFLGTIHYYSLPFLLLACLVSKSKIHFNGIEKSLFGVAVVYFLFSKIIGRTANLGMVFNVLFEPMLVMAYIRSFPAPKMKSIRYLLVLFFFIECGVALYEAMFSTIVFAKEVDIFDYLGDIRAYSLHGHPLQNAFIVGILSVTFVLSNLSKNLKFGLFLLGYVTIFAFNTRSSIYLMGVVLGIALFKEYLFGKGNMILKALGLAIVIFGITYAFDFIMAHSLGTRMETAINSNDGSSMARFVLINVFFMIPMEDLLLGVDPLYIKVFMQRFNLVGIENSIVSLIFFCGALFSIFYFPLMFKEIYFKKLSLYVKLLWYCFLFALLNVNNALVTDSPVLVISLLAICSFLVNTNFKIIKK